MKPKYAILFFSVTLILAVIVFLINYTFSQKWQLSRAIENGDYEKVGILLNNNKELIKEKINSLTPLHIATIARKPEIVKLLIKNGANVNQKGGRHNFTPLFSSSLLGDLKITNLLLNNGARVNAKNDFGKTPIFFAIEGNHLKTVDLLVKKNANVNLTTNAVLGNISVLYFAVDHGNPKIVSLLVKDGAEENKSVLLALVKKRINEQKDKNRERDYIEIEKIVEGMGRPGVKP